MSGHWIKVEHLLPNKPEVHAIADELGIDPDAVVGKLVRLWIWADQQLPSPRNISATLASLDRIVSTPGFAKAMQGAGWLEVSRKGISFPNFERHNGKTLKNRALAAIRMSNKRYAASATSASPKTETETKTKEEPPTPSESEPKTDPKPPPKSTATAIPDLPAALDTPAFHKAWADWQRYRAERRQKLTPTGAAAQLKQLAALGAARACELIERSIVNGYQGLIFPEDKQHDGERERVGRVDATPGKYAGIAKPVGGTGPPAEPPEGLAAGEGEGGAPC